MTGKTSLKPIYSHAVIITNLGIDSPVAASKLQAEILKESAVGAVKNMSWVKAPVLIGRGTSAGAALEATVDMKQGMDPKLAIGSNAAGATAGPAKAAGIIVAGAVMGTSWKRCAGSWYGYRASSRCWS